MSDAADERRETRSYLVGYGLALALTGAAFAAVQWQTFATTATLVVVYALALVQLIVHFRFFLHVGFARAARDDLLLLLFSALIIGLMVSGTLVLLFNLRMRMM